MIDNSSCLTAIQNIKSNVSNCFNRCTQKGSTYSGTETLSNLETAISLIPQEFSGDDTILIGADFGGFTITYPDDPSEDWFTIEFANYRTNWNVISCYSHTKQGHFNIVKLPNNQCIISSASFLDLASEWTDDSGIYPHARGTYRATYTINGTSITFTNNEYGASVSWDSADNFKGMPYQVDNYVNDYYKNQYKLDKITIL